MTRVLSNEARPSVEVQELRTTLPDLRREGSACGGDSRLVGEAEGPGDRRRAQVGARGAVDELLADCRTAFLRHDVEGLSRPQIAQTLQARLGS